MCTVGFVTIAVRLMIGHELCKISTIICRIYFMFHAVNSFIYLICSDRMREN